MFLAGYTAKVAGTEVGVVEPQATFSSCFGAPFLPQPPVGVRRAAARADQGARRAARGSSTPAGPAAPTAPGRACPSRPPGRSSAPRSSGELDGAPTRTDPNFGFEVPDRDPGRGLGAARPPRHLGRRRGLRRRGEGPRDAHPGARGRDGRLGGHPPAGTPHENITVLSGSSPGAIASLAVGMRWVRTLSWPAALLVGALVLAPAAHAGAPAPLLTITGSDADVWNVAQPTPVYTLRSPRTGAITWTLSGTTLKGSGPSPLRVELAEPQDGHLHAHGHPEEPGGHRQAHRAAWT